MRNNILQRIRLYNLKTLLHYAYVEVRLNTYMRFIKGSYSQNGEDLVIDKILGNLKNGFYVDIGANHPVRFNNTTRFYKKGWRGINIEPNVDKAKLFSKYRPEDINLNMGISQSRGLLSFYNLLPDTVSTFSKNEADASVKRGLKLVGVTKVTVSPLTEVFERHCSKVPIDFISIDTEGLDMEVLKSNDWVKFRPTCICIESIARSEEAGVYEQELYLTKLGYEKRYSNDTNDIYTMNTVDVVAS